ncbi:hypothetical protein [uncultured Amphritea sp.]|uniref:hypothetical protein n=1 Tax=uncultured Amphritea sp. TaxID=981605 RepID=UPI0026376977|nr:hypothetical protein [uncultured Amphritea sp.]
MTINSYKYPLMDFGKGPVVLLFFDGYDLHARDGFIGKVQSWLHHRLRNTKRRLYKQQPYTGFYVAFIGLVNSLKAIGCDVRVNDFKLAKRYPDYPIGVAGYPSILSRVDRLKNPRIFGPGDFGFPREDDLDVSKDSRYRYFIQPCDWFCQMYEPFCSGRMFRWPAGIDVESFQDLSIRPKKYDFLIYDKIRWHRETEEDRVLSRILNYLDKKGLTYTSVRYGQHHYNDFMQGLSDSKAMIFVCEHETQGLACQEALASNIPVLAWDEGKLVDPELKKLVSNEFVVSSVPYFNDSCGTRFTIDEFESCCDEFLQGNFLPRDFIQGNLSLSKLGMLYINKYKSLLRKNDESH